MREKHNSIGKIQDGKDTQRVHKELLNVSVDIDYNIDDNIKNEIEKTEYWKYLQKATPFIDGINKRLKELGLDQNAPLKEKVNFILSKCKEHGIPTDSSTSTVFLSKPTLKNWLKDPPEDEEGNPLSKAPPKDHKRKNVFLLCFALEMNREQCKEFFLKSFLSRPFNHKDTTEAVYFHCFDQGKPYTKAVEILKRIESSPKQDLNHDRQDVATNTIEKTISEITDEDELVSYLLENQFDENEHHITIRKEIEELLKENQELATYKKVKESSEKHEPIIKSNPQLLDYIFGFKENCQNLGKFSKYLPPLLGNNLLTRQDLLKILKGTTKNDDMYRKALVLLYFFNYYAAAWKEQVDGGEDEDLVNFQCIYDDFVYQLDAILEKCGYLQLYPRHPFDWLILYCARHPDPLLAWDYFIENYYRTHAD